MPEPGERAATAAAAAAPPLSLPQRVALRLVLAALWLARKLPDRLVYRVAYAIGAGLSLVMPARRAVVRANLRRVCAWLAANDLALPRVARAATDERALDGLVRATFGHWLVTYAEGALAPRYGREELRERIVPVDAEVSAAALARREPGAPGPIHMAMHFGSVDLSALYGARVGELPLTGPMELVASPLGRAYFEHVRLALGVTIVPVGEAAAAMVAALERGEGVGIVADRNVVGRGTPVPLFGAPARLPIGPAVLAVQTGAPLYLEAIERTGAGQWLGHTVALGPAVGATRREATRQLLEQEARTMERIIARAPEQWTTLFFPIWDEGGE